MIKIKKIVFVLFIVYSTFINAKTLEMLSPYTGESYQVSVLTEEELDNFYQFVSTRSYIPFHIKWDGCFGRAYRMITVANRKNIELGKLVVDVTNKKDEVIEVLSPDGKWKLRWYYHVAPYVYVETFEGNLELRIIDPSLFDRPVTRSEFINRLTMDNPAVELEQVLIPKFVGSKTQRLDEVNLGKLDRNMLTQMSQITGTFKSTGAYHELKPVYDHERKAWFQGGWPVEAPMEE
jgi:hypothetical protein